MANGWIACIAREVRNKFGSKRCVVIYAVGRP